MDIVISTRDARPIYEQIKEQIESAIIRGDISEGDQLPSIRALANDLGVSVITTKRAYADLEEAGFVRSVQGRGCFVSARDSSAVIDERTRRVKSEMQSAIGNGRRAGMDNSMLRTLFESCLDE